jgi:recombination protein RecA
MVGWRSENNLGEEMENTMASNILTTLVRKGTPPVDSFSFLALDHLSQTLRLPRGAISEILGRPSSGRTALLHAMLAESLSRGEICAFIDCADSFDPATARNNGVTLERLLWVRCGQKPDRASLERALKAADWILHRSHLILPATIALAPAVCSALNPAGAPIFQ